MTAHPSTPTTAEADLLAAASKTGVALPTLSLPTRRTQGWKYADLRKALSGHLQAVPATIEIQGIETQGQATVEPQAIALEPEATDLARLHSALAQVEQRIEIEGEQELSLTFAAPDDQQVACRQVRVRIAPGANLRIRERYQGDSDSFLATQVIYELGEGARLERVIDDRLDGVVLWARVQFALGAKAATESFGRMTGSRLARHDWRVDHRAAGSFARFHGALDLAGSQHANIRLQVHHHVAGCETQELFKTTANDRGHAAFEGCVHVAPGAVQTVAEQAHHGLLLSENAEINALPELEIFADDVICAHGATCGALDEQALFYAQARGIPEAEARTMLTAAFLSEPFDEAPPWIRQHFGFEP